MDARQPENKRLALSRELERTENGPPPEPDASRPIERAKQVGTCRPASLEQCELRFYRTEGTAGTELKLHNPQGGVRCSRTGRSLFEQALMATSQLAVSQKLTGRGMGFGRVRGPPAEQPNDYPTRESFSLERSAGLAAVAPLT